MKGVCSPCLVVCMRSGFNHKQWVGLRSVCKDCNDDKSECSRCGHPDAGKMLRGGICAKCLGVQECLCKICKKAGHAHTKWNAELSLCLICQARHRGIALGGSKEFASPIVKQVRQANSSLKCALCEFNQVQLDNGCCRKCEESKHKVCKLCKSAGHAFNMFNSESYECTSCAKEVQESRQTAVRAALEKENKKVHEPAVDEPAVDANLNAAINANDARIICIENEEIKKSLSTIGLDGINY